MTANPRSRRPFPQPAFPRELNYTYDGHTSDIFPTPWPTEGRYMHTGERRRFTSSLVWTPEERAERDRLADIENPGRCRARRHRVDAWCTRVPAKGMHVCKLHGRIHTSSKSHKRHEARVELEAGAARILRRAIG